MLLTSAATDHCQAAVQNQGAMGRSDRTPATIMLRIITVAAAAALVALALTSAGTPVRAEDDCDAVTKRALREFKTTLDQHKERWVELQGTANESDPPIMQLCNYYKLFPPAYSSWSQGVKAPETVGRN